MERFYFSSMQLNLAVVWDGSKAQEVLLNPESSGGYDKSVPEPVKQFFDELETYLSGGKVIFSLPINWERLTPFARKVSKTLTGTKPGEVLSYGELARLAGNPKAARAVGRVMARNPFPLIIPCHRVVGSDGSLTGFGGGLKLKQRLLELEQGIR